ncbi:MAG: DUF2304 family protein [Bdellovibrionales bacterium]|nr:DUF2304 family protein [Bdellovibrionales bacterium]
MIPSLFILTILLVLLATDYLFLPRQARRAFLVMGLVFGLIGLLAVFPNGLSAVASWVGIGRGVDLIVYLALIVLVREYFISRSRQAALESQLTSLVRQIALMNPDKNSDEEHA